MKLERVILYQNGIGYFERSGHVGGSRIVLPFSRHEVDDVLKTLTVISKQGAGVATVDVPEIKEKDRVVNVGVKLSGGTAHDVRVTYAIPTPTWKAAYRVVLDGDAKPDAPTGLLQGWAVIDNASQEDWSDVRLTLATGAPMSYALDLKTPQYVERPDVTGKLVKPVVLGAVEAEKVTAGEGDKDKDGIATKDDLCPDDAEDKDGFEDEDGCPEPDNDKDRISDKGDQCPNEPETYNGYDDEDGCPDRGRVVVTDTAIEILDMVYFPTKSSGIKKESEPILDATAASLNGNPSILRVEVQGHAASGEANAMKLSEDRARAVKAYLVKKGVDSKRLQVQGYGDTQPLVRGNSEKDRAKNRRVAFLILKRSSEDDEAPRRDTPVYKPPVVIDTKTASESVRTATKPVEVAGAVRYVLGEPVTIRRNSSTMVSILNKSVTAEDAYLWRPDGNAPGSDQHPFRAVRLVNSSGFTLQPGSIAIFARGTFVGDSLLAQLGIDETAWVPYALDSGTTVTRETAEDEHPVRIVAIAKGTMTVENAGSIRTTYTVAAAREPARKIYFKHAKSYGYKAVEVPAGTTEQPDAYLIPLPLSPGKTSELAIEERQPRRRSLSLSYADPKELSVYIQGSHLPPDLDGKLKTAITLRADLATVELELYRIRRRQQEVADRGYELRDNIETLANVKTAADLKKKLLASLAENVAEAESLAKELAGQNEIAAAARTKLSEAIRVIQLDEPTR
jgi:outer membrane protein OmpA-like peptidoglycan-associated protein